MPHSACPARSALRAARRSSSPGQPLAKELGAKVFGQRLWEGKWSQATELGMLPASPGPAQRGCTGNADGTPRKATGSSRCLHQFVCGGPPAFFECVAAPVAGRRLAAAFSCRSRQRLQSFSRLVRGYRNGTPGATRTLASGSGGRRSIH